MKRDIFYEAVRRTPFPNRLMQSQVMGMEIILNEWDKRQLVDTRWLAYILASVFHETAATMQPIEEYGQGKGRSYGSPDPETGQIYYGRGFIQLTWRKNYALFDTILGTQLVHHPNQALDPTIATQILFEGMLKGLYTGVGLSKYFRPHDPDSDWYNARRIVNRLDKAELIAKQARAFWFAILLAEGKLEQAATLLPKAGVAPKPAEYEALTQEFALPLAEY